MESPGERGITQRTEAGREELRQELSDAGVAGSKIDDLAPYIEYYAEQRIFPFIRNAFLVFAVIAGLAWLLYPLAGVALGVLAGLVGIAVGLQYPHYRRANRMKAELLESPRAFVKGDTDWAYLEEKYEE